jgi:hypothetical protein
LAAYIFNTIGASRDTFADAEEILTEAGYHNQALDGISANSAKAVAQVASVMSKDSNIWGAGQNFVSTFN